jgi:NAD(P)-dependent dehydrogenase (short-subunit alcohol dehydrogenase family)
MTATTHANFNEHTGALEVAKEFAQAIRGKTIIITGVNLKGIGFSTAKAFASQSPAHLIIAGRNESKLQESIDAIKKDYPEVDCRMLILDLGSQTAVRKAAQEVLSWNDVPTVDILVSSAGIAGIPKRTLSEDGIEITFATNHIGHFLFTNLILPKMVEAAKASPKGTTRIINVSSGATEANGIRWSDLNFDKVSSELPEIEQPNYNVLALWGIKNGQDLSYTGIEAYIQSKAANTLFGIALTNRLYEKYGILSVANHPGVIDTELARHSSPEQMKAIKERERSGEFRYKTLDQGAATSLVAAMDPALGVSETRDGKEGYGSYLKDCQISHGAHPRAKSSEEAEKLWKLSEELVNQKFPW